MKKPNRKLFPNVSANKGFSLTELMVTIAIVGIIMAVGPNLVLQMFRFWWTQTARASVQRDARSSLDLVNRQLRQASASSVVISCRPNQPPYSWITFSVDKGEGDLLGDYGFFQEGTNLKYMNKGSTVTISDNLKYVAFTYPHTDDSAIISVSMTFEKATYSGYAKALQLSVEKVRVMN